jgi:hypothetical protein
MDGGGGGFEYIREKPKKKDVIKQLRFKLKYVYWNFI